jgi:hypothetical protein
MSGAELLTDLARQGFSLTPEGGGIRVRPASRLSEDLREAIRTHKDELLAQLAGLPPSTPAVASGRCPGCRGPLDDKVGCRCCPPRPTTWPDPDGAELVAWFSTFVWPRKPFALAPWRQVTDPELFCQTLAEDLARGPGGPHVHHGHVIADLRLLRQRFGTRSEGTEMVLAELASTP